MAKKLKIDRFIIYSIIFWLSLGVIALWIVLKLVGVFESPVWQEILPYAGAIFAAGTFYQMIYDFRIRINRIENRQDRMARGLVRLESDFSHLRKDVNNLRQDLSILRQDFNTRLAKY